jgi:hypothetical protein
MAVDDQQIYHKYVPVRTFNLIRQGKQTYLPKISDGFWKDVENGTRIFLITCNTPDACEIKITGKTYFRDFGDAWYTHDTAVFPDNSFTSRDEVNNNFYAFKNDVDNFGVVCANFQLV